MTSMERLPDAIRRTIKDGGGRISHRELTKRLQHRYRVPALREALAQAADVEVEKTTRPGGGHSLVFYRLSTETQTQVNPMTETLPLPALNEFEGALRELTDTLMQHRRKRTAKAPKENRPPKFEITPVGVLLHTPDEVVRARDMVQGPIDRAIRRLSRRPPRLPSICTG